LLGAIGTKIGWKIIKNYPGNGLTFFTIENRMDYMAFVPLK
jgi:hypothetical protein